MIFVLLFVVGTFAVPLTIEMYRRGNDNVVSRAGTELLHAQRVQQMVNRYAVLKTGVTNFTGGIIALGVGGLLILIGFWVMWTFLGLIARMIFSR